MDFSAPPTPTPTSAVPLADLLSEQRHRRFPEHFLSLLRLCFLAVVSLAQIHSGCSLQGLVFLTPAPERVHMGWFAVTPPGVAGAVQSRHLWPGLGAAEPVSSVCPGCHRPETREERLAGPSEARGDHILTEAGRRSPCFSESLTQASTCLSEGHPPWGECQLPSIH